MLRRQMESANQNYDVNELKLPARISIKEACLGDIRPNAIGLQMVTLHIEISRTNKERVKVAIRYRNYSTKLRG